MKVVVDRARWLRGEGGDDSKLLRRMDGKMCCMGFACIAAGAEPEDIKGLTTVGQVDPFALDWSGANCRGMNGLDDLYSLNDSYGLSDDDREQRIVAAGNRVGLQFEFTGEGR